MDRIEQCHRRHVERHLQRLAYRDRTLERQVEVFRRVRAVADRAILDQRLGMDQSVLEREAVDERLERGAGRAQGLRHVDLTGAALVEIIGARDPREHFAGRVLDRDDRDRDVRAERVGALARELFERPLHGRVNRERDNLAPLRRRHCLVGRVGREHRHRPAARLHMLRFCQLDLIRGNAPGKRDPFEHARTRTLRGVNRAIGPACFGRLRDRHQQRCFRERQPPRLLAEIGERGGTHAFEIAAIGCQPEIEREDFILCQRSLELNRAHRLPQLGQQRALGAWLEQARYLHRNGRAARHDAAVRHQLRRRTHHSERIDAAVRIEALVLVRDQQIEVARIDVRDGRGQPPAAIRRRVGAQQLPVAIDHDGGEFDGLAERCRTEGIDPGHESGSAHDAGGRRRERASAKAAPW